MPTLYDATRPTQLDEDEKGFRYYRNAVERHWDPQDIDLSVDRENVSKLPDEVFEQLHVSLAKFGAGEQSVTEDLSPLAVVLSDVEDQMFVTTQLYEEAKHTDFFDRYWKQVIHPEEDARGWEPTSPLDPKWFDDDYVELFDRNDEAMALLLTDDTSENRAKAYCHYHLVIEGILAQTGYYGLTKVWGPQVEEYPELPGLVEGINLIRQDEGRHVGFGMAKLRDLVQSGEVDAELLDETVGELVLLVQGTLTPDEEEQAALDELPQVLDDDELTEYAIGKHTERMGQITDAAQAIPDVDQLTALEG
ncbi:MAG TPA: ribonucleotide-diphosphate reductase subunit beta [Halobacteriales archaeon]|nr:ribonucleotide-diphosphate reductase subunit beta [Halobacteriales archaeon]